MTISGILKAPLCQSRLPPLGPAWTNILGFPPQIQKSLPVLYFILGFPKDLFILLWYRQSLLKPNFWIHSTRSVTNRNAYPDAAWIWLWFANASVRVEKAPSFCRGRRNAATIDLLQNFHFPFRSHLLETFHMVVVYDDETLLYQLRKKIIKKHLQRATYATILEV